MPFYTRYPFDTKKFKNDPNVLTEAVFDFIKNEKHIQFSEHYEFCQSVTAHANAFTNAYLQANTPQQKNEVMKQYNQFFQTLERCLNEPYKVKSHIRNYHNPYHYVPVGCTNYHHPSSQQKYISGALISLAMLALIGGCIAIPFCLPAAIGLISFSVLTLLATTATLWGSNYLDVEPFKEEERELFKDGAEIVQNQTMNASIYDEKREPNDSELVRRGHHSTSSYGVL